MAGAPTQVDDRADSVDETQTNVRPASAGRLDWAVLALGGIYLTYLVSRLFLIWRLPVFWDEGFYAAQAQTGLDLPGQRFQFLADGKPPLFNWASIVMVDLGFAPVTAVRMVSFLAGLATLTAIMLIARRLMGTSGALLVGTLYVVVPYDLVYNGYGLIDGMFTAAMMITLCLQLRLATRPTGLVAVATGVALGAAILTRQTGQVGIVLFPASLLVFDWAGKDRASRLLRWGGLVALALMISFTVNLVTRLTPLHAVLSNPGQSRSPMQALKDPFAYLHGNWPGIHGALTGYLGWPILVVALVGIVTAAVRRDRLALLLVLWAAAPLGVVLMLVRFGFPRYTVSMVPPLLVLVGYGVVALAGVVRARLDDDWSNVVLVFGAVALVVVPLILDVQVLRNPGTAKYPPEDRYQYTSGWPAGTGLDEIKAVIERDAPAGKTLVVGIDFTPWNLAAQFDHPVRIPSARIPFYDAVQARLSGGRTVEFASAGPDNTPNARFIVQHDSFGVPYWLDLKAYRLVVSFLRPGGGTVQGKPIPPTTLQLYERN